MSPRTLTTHRIKLKSFATVLALCPALVFAKPFLGYTGMSWNEDMNVLKGSCAVDLAQASGHASLAQNAQSDIIFTEEKPDTLVDTRCFAHTLELVPSGQAVKWTNPKTGSHLFLKPGRHSDDCRSFTLVKVTEGQQARHSGVACSDQPGVWQIVSQG